MRKREFKLTKKEEIELHNAYIQSQDGPTRTRYQAVRLYGKGYPTEEVLEITGCSRVSLMEWCRWYRQDGIAGLLDKRNGGNSAKLKASQLNGLQEPLPSDTPVERLGVENCFGDGQFWTVEDVAALVKKSYGIAYQSRGSYGNVLKRCGFSYQRPEQPYRSRREADVLEFEAELEKKLLDIAQQAPQTLILAEDEASLYLQATTKAVWAPRGQTPLIRIHPGRENVHF